MSINNTVNIKTVPDLSLQNTTIDSYVNNQSDTNISTKQSSFIEHYSNLQSGNKLGTFEFFIRSFIALFPGNDQNRAILF